MECTRSMNDASAETPLTFCSSKSSVEEMLGSSCMPSTGSMETIVATALHEVSSQERNEALHDIHGVSDPMKEVESDLPALLDDMDKQISNIELKSAYDKAESLSREYVADSKLRLNFLRSERHDPLKAAQRMVKHFEWKLSLFGDDKLVREIRWSDFDSAEIEYFRSRHFQLRPQRDCVGRPILCMAKSTVPTNAEAKMMQRYYWYISMVASESEEAQTKGAVGIWYYSVGSQPTTFSACNSAQTIELTNAVPLRHAAVHICYDNEAARPFLMVGAQKMENSLRIRAKYHFGSHQEAQHALMTFGIPRSVLPVNWWDSSSESQSPFVGVKVVSPEPEATKYIAKPGRFDVLLGRGKVIEGSPGNLRFRSLIETSRVRYDAAPRYDKVVVAQCILARVKEAGGRFLRHVGEGWIEVDNATAREKVSHSFRNHRNRPRARRALQNRLAIQIA